MIWVLTEEYNQYDQYGEYFIHAWVEKPTKEQLSKLVDPKEADYLLETGGGRKHNYENNWYYLREMEE